MNVGLRRKAALPDPAIVNLVRVFDRNPRAVEDVIFEKL